MLGTKPRRPKRHRRLLVGTSVLFVGFLLAEASLRIVGVTYPVFDTYDPELGVILRAGKTGWYRKEGEAFLRINSLGYRDEEHDLIKPAETLRVAFLGDSCTEARQVDLAKTFWKIVEARLDRSSEVGGRRVEALGFGVGGYGTAQQLMVLRRVRFTPDVVVLALFVGNDLINNSRALSARRGDVFRPFFSLEGEELLLDQSFSERTPANLWKRFLLESVHHLRLLEVVNQARRAHQTRKISSRGPTARGDVEKASEPGIAVAALGPPSNGVWEDAWKITEHLILTIDTEVKAAGARFVLLIVNSPIQVSLSHELRAKVAEDLGQDDLFYAERRLSSLGDRAGFAAVPLAPALQALADREGVFLHGFENTALGRGHWNERGHAAAAEQLLPALWSE